MEDTKSGRVKDYSRVVKAVLVIMGLSLSIMKFMNLLPNATIGEIWLTVSAAYGVCLGTIDFNIIRDTWVGK